MIGNDFMIPQNIVYNFEVLFQYMWDINDKSHVLGHMQNYYLTMDLSKHVYYSQLNRSESNVVLPFLWKKGDDVTEKEIHSHFSS